MTTSNIQSTPEFEKALTELRNSPTVKPLTSSRTFQGNAGTAGIVVVVIGYLSTPAGAELITSIDPRLTLLLPVLLNVWNVYQRSRTTSGVALTKKRAAAINETVEREIKEAVRTNAVDVNVPFAGVEGHTPAKKDEPIGKGNTIETTVNNADTQEMSEPEEKPKRRRRAKKD